jgi:hypothetical protein
LWTEGILGVFGWRSNLAMPKMGHIIVFSVAVWFTTTDTARRTFLAPCPTCHTLIFVPKLAISLALINF